MVEKKPQNAGTIADLDAQISKIYAKLESRNADYDQARRELNAVGKQLSAFSKNPNLFKQYLAEIGSKGGKTAARNMTKAQRSARAKKAAAARHVVKKGGKR